MAFLLRELGKGFGRALESTSAEISAWVSISEAACASTCAWYGEAEFYSHIYIPGPSRRSRLDADPQLAGFAVQKLQLARKKNPIRWAGGRIIEVMIGAVQRQLIVMEAGGDGGGAQPADRALGGLREFQTRMWNKRYLWERSQELFSFKSHSLTTSVSYTSDVNRII